MAQAYARNQLKQNPETPLILKIEGIPFDTNIRSEQDVLKKVLEKRIQNLKYEKIMLHPHETKPVVTCYVQSSDV